MFYFLLFVFGLAVGSFLNVASMRYPKSVRGRSRCPHCRKVLNWHELIPIVSYVIQKGKCRNCGNQLSLQYPLVEALTGGVFLSLGYYFQRFSHLPDFSAWQGYILLLLWIVAAVCLILIALIDLRLFIIPDGLSITIAIIGILLTALKSNYLNHTLTAVLSFLVFGFVVVITKGRGMGMGDVKLAGAIGLLLGFPSSLIAFMAAFIIGAVWGVGLILFRKKSPKDAVPFGPFLVLGVFFALFFSNAIFDIIRL